ncbi:hypothetical protein AFM11_33440 [Mycolicibacterium wolinskyi]|uniref:Uncharacterized protein n=2 Tax=Mycolicibacterium wolinskyi TaxID=59750 RepID=A0A132PC24_9MYCO|nr:hypothetical protein AFM11_33440 [Mycolicibacterium wolinskyi]
MDRDEYLAIQRANEAHAERLRNRPRPSFAELGSRMANASELMPVKAKRHDPRQKWETIDALDHLINSPVSATPKLATEHQVNQVLASMIAGEHLPVAEGEVWVGIVAKALRDYHSWFESDPERAAFGEGIGSRFELDNLPQTHDNTDKYGEVLVPWNPQRELGVAVVVSTSRPGHRWLLRGITTIQSVIGEVQDDQHCDLGYGRCTRSTKPSAFNAFPFHHGDLVVIAHVCRECWQQWIDVHIPEPPEEIITENDVATPPEP